MYVFVSISSSNKYILLIILVMASYKQLEKERVVVDRVIPCQKSTWYRSQRSEASLGISRTEEKSLASKSNRKAENSKALKSI